MKIPLEVHYIVGWLVYFAFQIFALKWIVVAGWAVAARFPHSQVMQHVCVLSAIVASLIVSYVLFRLIVKNYLFGRTQDEAAPPI